MNEINALLMHDTDNVVTCVREIAAGKSVNYRKDGEILTLTAADDIPYCHKVALVDIPKGGHVTKYGELIGEATESIPRGGWVSDKNIVSVPRDYESAVLYGISACRRTSRYPQSRSDSPVMCVRERNGTYCRLAGPRRRQHYF